MTANRTFSPLLVTPWYGGTVGGVAVATESLAHSLLLTGSDCAVIRLAPDGVVPVVSVGISGEEVVDVCVRSDAHSRGSVKARLGYYIRRLEAKKTFRRLVKQHDLRIAHFHFASAEYDVLMRFAREAGLGIVTTFHGADINAFLGDPGMRSVVRKIAFGSDRITVVSRTLRDRLTTAFPDVAPRVSLIANLVPTSFAVRNAALVVPPANPRWHVLIVGHLIRRKGGDVLIDAAAEVIRTVPDLRVAFAGVGEFGATLRTQAEKLGISAHFEFLGELSREAIEDAYRQTMLLAIPSRSEGLPLVLLESQWMGVPVVASAVDGLPDAISQEENGLLVPAEDPNALAVAITRVITNEELRMRISEAAMQRARAQFSPTITASLYQDVYAEAYADSRRRPKSREVDQ